MRVSVLSYCCNMLNMTAWLKDLIPLFKFKIAWQKVWRQF
jgi:hypothetical protein